MPSRRSPAGKLLEPSGAVNVEMAFLRARESQAKATAEMAQALVAATERFGPAADTLHGFGQRLDALCMFLTKKGPWVLASIPAVLVSINAISPAAAKALGAVLAVYFPH